MKIDKFQLDNLYLDCSTLKNKIVNRHINHSDALSSILQIVQEIIQILENEGKENE